jgi:hypothetical protein
VRGAVHISAHSELRARGVVVHAIGDEITTLGPNVLMTDHTHPFDLSFHVWSPSIEQDKLSAGAHTFPFEFVLPTTLPPTFNGELTKIAYRLVVKIDVPLRADLHLEQPFKVRVPLLIDADKPLRATASVPPGLTLELDLKASGFCPGDHIIGELRVIGLGTQSIKAVKVDLLSRETGEAHEFVDHVEKVRVREEIDPARLIDGQPFSIDLPIPPDVDPSFTGQHSAKARTVRAQIELADGHALTTEAVIRVGAH